MCRKVKYKSGAGGTLEWSGDEATSRPHNVYPRTENSESHWEPLQLKWLIPFDMNALKYNWIVIAKLDIFVSVLIRPLVLNLLQYIKMNHRFHMLEAARNDYGSCCENWGATSSNPQRSNSGSRCGPPSVIHTPTIYTEIDCLRAKTVSGHHLKGQRPCKRHHGVYKIKS